MKWQWLYDLFYFRNLRKAFDTVCQGAQFHAARAKKLDDAIRAHRAQKADDRCIEDDDRLYEALGDGIKCDRRVGNKKEMLKNCERFIDRRCVAGNWPTYADLEERIRNLEELLRLRSLT